MMGLFQVPQHVDTLSSTIPTEATQAEKLWHNERGKSETIATHHQEDS